MSVTAAAGVGGQAGHVPSFVPPDFVVPVVYENPPFRLVPIGPEHNDRDYDAWTSSVDHIRRTPGFAEYSWPREMTNEQNLSDVMRHADEFRQRTAFMYTVIVDNEIVGCVHIYPSGSVGHANVLSWVRQDRASLDEELYDGVDRWLHDYWPFSAITYASRSPT